MKPWIAGGLGVVAMIFATIAIWSALIAPPHYFIVNAGRDATSASLAVGDAAPGSAIIFAGFALARTDVVESAAVLEVAFSDGRKRRCQFGYFTHSEFEPHYLQIGECDQRWH